MTLMKSLLLGSAAGVVAVASAQAADLPTRKGPVAVEYVRICSITVAGAPVVGFVLPGSDTCFKISGYITGQIEGGNSEALSMTMSPAREQACAGSQWRGDVPSQPRTIGRQRRRRSRVTRSACPRPATT